MLTEDEIKGLKFEEGLKKLEELVTHLDDGNLSFGRINFLLRNRD